MNELLVYFVDVTSAITRQKFINLLIIYFILILLMLPDKHKNILYNTSTPSHFGVGDKYSVRMENKVAEIASQLFFYLWYSL